MSQYQADQFGQCREVSIKVNRSRSPQATWALRLAVPFFVPLLPLVGMVIGWLALGNIRKNAARTGIGHAKAAVWLGGGFTVAQALLGWVGWQYFETAQRGPEAALRIGLNGDVNGFASRFEFTGDPNSVEHAFDFLTVLRDRYGQCRDVTLVLPEGYASLRPFEPLQYEVRFAGKTIPATAEFVMQPNILTWDWEPRLAYIQLHDAEHGDVRFPPEGSTSYGASALAEVDED